MDLKKQELKFVVSDEYRDWINTIKDKIRTSQIKASIKVNREMLELYWNIGADIVDLQENSKWGEGLIKQMSLDLRKAFPDAKGFSETNLKTIRIWYRFYSDVIKGLQVVDEISAQFSN